MTKITHRCPSCGSDDVCAEASAKWDNDKQEWIMSDVHDMITCQECGYDANVEGYFEVPLTST